MQKALEQLGFGPCYHMYTIWYENPRDCSMWLEAFKAKYDRVGTFGKEQWDQLLANHSVSLFTLRKRSSKFAYLDHVE